MIRIEVEHVRAGKCFLISWRSRDRQLFDETKMILQGIIPARLRRWSSSASAWSVDDVAEAAEPLRAFIAHMREHYDVDIIPTGTPAFRLAGR